MFVKRAAKARTVKGNDGTDEPVAKPKSTAKGTARRVTSYDDEEEEDDSAFIRRQRKDRAKIPSGKEAISSNTTDIGASRDSTYSRQDIERLRMNAKIVPRNQDRPGPPGPPAKTEQDEQREIEPTIVEPGPDTFGNASPSLSPITGEDDFVALDEFEPEVIEEERGLNDTGLDIDEGRGFEDEQLNFDQPQDEQLARKRQEIAEAINNAHEVDMHLGQSDDDDEWVADQIRRGFGGTKYVPPPSAKSGASARPKFSQLDSLPKQLPSLPAELDKLKTMLSGLETRKGEYLQMIEETRAQLAQLDHRQQLLEESMEKASIDLKQAENSLHQRTT